MAARTNSVDPRAERVRTKLREAAFALAHERPVDQLTVGDIVDRASVSRQVFYQHFRDRDDAIAYAVAVAFASATGDIDGDPRTRIVALFDFAAEHRAMYRNVVPSAVTLRVLAAFRAELAPACKQIAAEATAAVADVGRPDPGIRRPVPCRRVHRGPARLDGRQGRHRSAWQGHRRPGHRRRAARPLGRDGTLNQFDSLRRTFPWHGMLHRGDKTGIRNIVIAMAALTAFVVAMIASYSGAFAKPTLHHLTVAVAAPEQVVDAVRSQEALNVNVVGDDAQARQQVRERQADTAFVVDPTGAMKIYVAGGGGRSVAAAAETVGHEVAAKGGMRAMVTDVAPTSAADPSGTVEFYAIIFISIGASLGATVFGYLMGRVHSPATIALRTTTLTVYSALLAGVVTVYVDAVLGALTGHVWLVFGVLWLYAMAVGGAVTGVAAAFGTAASALLTLFLVVVGNAAAAGPVGQTPAVAVLRHLHDDRPAGFGRLTAAQHLLLRRPRRCDSVADARGMGCGRMSARGPRHRIAGELSCPL